MRAKTFKTVDLVSSIVAVLFLLFLFIYPHCRLKNLRDDILPLCDLVIEEAGAGAWEEAVMHTEEIKSRFGQDEKLTRMILDHEDLDSATNAIDTAILMAKRENDAQTISETENIRSIVTYLAGIETLTLVNLF